MPFHIGWNFWICLSMSDIFMIYIFINAEFWKQVPPNEPYRVILGDVRDKLYNTRERARHILANGVSDIPEDATFTNVEQVSPSLQFLINSLVMDMRLMAVSLISNDIVYYGGNMLLWWDPNDTSLSKERMGEGSGCGFNTPTYQCVCVYIYMAAIYCCGGLVQSHSICFSGC